MAKKFKRITNPQSAADRKRRDQVQESIKQEFPPAKTDPRPKGTGIAADFWKPSRVFWG